MTLYFDRKFFQKSLKKHETENFSFVHILARLHFGSFVSLHFDIKPRNISKPYLFDCHL